MTGRGDLRADPDPVDRERVVAPRRVRPRTPQRQGRAATVTSWSRLGRRTDAFDRPTTPPNRRPGGLLRALLAVLDLTVVALGWTIGVVIAEYDPMGWSLTTSLIVQLSLVLPAGALLLSVNGLYLRRICQVRALEVSRIARTTAMLVFLLVLVLLPSFRTSGQTTAAAIAAAGITWLALLTLERGLIREWIQLRRARGQYGAPVLVMGGSATSTLKIAEFLADNPVLGFEVRGVLCPPDPACASARFEWRGSPEDLPDVAVAGDVSGVVLDASSLNGQLTPAVRTLTQADLHVHVHSGLRGVERRRITLAPLVDETFLHIGPLGLVGRQRVAKRLLDLVVASALLVISGPLLLATAIGIRLTDGGPVLYRQTRVGYRGEPFTLLKLRTMYPGADRDRPGLTQQNLRHGPLFKVSDDPRTTRLGRLLRATSIDELPQLLNVLRGSMSMVGPRPALPDEVAQFDEELAARTAVKPGVTGLWQVEARDLANFDLYRRLDLLYVQNWSVGLDMAVILRTVGVVLVRTLRGLVPGAWRAADHGVGQ